MPPVHGLGLGLPRRRLPDAGAGVTWSPNDKSADITLSGDMLTAMRGPAANAWRSARATLGRPLAGDKRYFEVLILGSGTPNMAIGFATAAADLALRVGNDPNGYSYNITDGNRLTSGINNAYGPTATAGDVISVMHNQGFLYFAKNGVVMASGDPVGNSGYAYNMAAGTYFPMCSIYEANATAAWQARFKLSAFSYAPPAGFLPWE